MTTDKRQDSAEADRALLQRVKRSLDQRGYTPLRSLKISVKRGVVFVQGTLPTFYLRQIAIGWIKRVACVTQVVDQIEVVDVADQSQPSAEDDAEQEPYQPWLRRHMDLRDRAQSAVDAFHTHFLDEIWSGQHAVGWIHRMAVSRAPYKKRTVDVVRMNWCVIRSARYSVPLDISKEMSHETIQKYSRGSG